MCSMHHRFNFKCTLQASAFLLRLDGKRMACLCLPKLLYIAYLSRERRRCLLHQGHVS